MSAVLTPSVTAALPNPLGLPLQALQAGLRRFTVAEYHRLIELGLLTEDDDIELLDGYLVHKMSRNPPHDGSLLALQDILSRLLPAGWLCRVQSALTAVRSEPEPDLAIVRGNRRTYYTRHPGPADCGIVIEVSDTTLAGDRMDKGRIYAEAGLPEYWVVNLVDRQVEVFTSPHAGIYATRTIYLTGDSAPVMLDGVTVATVAVADVMP